MKRNEDQRSHDVTIDLRSTLSADHARLEAMFAQMLQAFETPGAGDASAQLWTEFDERLRAHLMLEEELILPRFALIDLPESAALIADHHAIRQKLVEIGVDVDLHMAESASVAAFIALLREHARREDHLMYLWAQTGIREPQVLAAIRQRLAMFRAQHQARSFPRH